MRFGFTILLVVGLVSSPLPAKRLTYEEGKIVRIDVVKLKVPATLNSGQKVVLPLVQLRRIQIQSGDLVYVASCEERRYKPEWHVNDAVHFRVDKHDLYLVRPNGKEFRFMFETTYTPSGGWPKKT